MHLRMTGMHKNNALSLSGGCKLYLPGAMEILSMGVMNSFRWLKREKHHRVLSRKSSLTRMKTFLRALDNSLLQPREALPAATRFPLSSGSDTLSVMIGSMRWSREKLHQHESKHSLE